MTPLKGDNFSSNKVSRESGRMGNITKDGEGLVGNKDNRDGLIG